MAKISVEDLPVAGKKVLVRVDFNVPLQTGSDGPEVADDTRIRAAIPTLNSITSRGGAAILLSHLGRPDGAVNSAYSLSPVAKHLAGLVDSPVLFHPKCDGLTVTDVTSRLQPGSILLLENTRFLAGETKNSAELAAFWASLADFYVNDAFGAAHRAHASTEAIAKATPTAAMGLLLKKEVDYLSRLLPGADVPAKKPIVAIIGGAKVSDKIGILESLLRTADSILIGGAMAYTFLHAQGVATGNSLVEADCVELASTLFRDSEGKILLPVDHVVAAKFDNDAPSSLVSGGIPEGTMGLDIGPATVEMYVQCILAAGTVVWNGPMGVFEMPHFAAGTFAIARALAKATAAGTLTVVGGGDSVAAITQARLEDQVSHVSTGGGAMLEFLEGKTLPGIAALTDSE